MQLAAEFVIRLGAALIAIVLIVVGVLTSISPVPLGFVLVLVGIVVLALADPHARPMLRWLRRRWPWLDRRLRGAQKKAPTAIAEPLEETDPTHDP